MKLHSLCVENYRNIRAARFTPGEELTVLCGENGQGKTNLLEAVWLLTGSKSFRNAKDAQLIRQGEDVYKRQHIGRARGHKAAVLTQKG